MIDEMSKKLEDLLEENKINDLINGEIMLRIGHFHTILS